MVKNTTSQLIRRIFCFFPFFCFRRNSPHHSIPLGKLFIKKERRFPIPSMYQIASTAFLGILLWASGAQAMFGTEKNIQEVAENLHRDWQRKYRLINGPGATRWKPAADPESRQWVRNNRHALPLKKGAYRFDSQGQLTEVNILELPLDYLPPGWGEENRKAAKYVAHLLLSNGGGRLPSLAAYNAMRERYAHLIHENWLERNRNWASLEQKLPYAQLSSSEKDKDRSILDIAYKALKKMGY